MKKALVIFAASSMLATGVSLASNVSFGHKMAAFLSEAFEFVGPISGLVNALVKHPDTPKTRVIPTFQDGISGPQHGGNTGQPPNIAKPPLSGAGLAPTPAQVLSGADMSGAAHYSSLSSRNHTDTSEHSLGSGAHHSNFGSIAQAITEKGDNAVLANLGKSLQGKFQDSTNGSGKDVWASLMNKPELAPTKLALNIERSHKQEDAGARIAQSITNQGHTQNAASEAASILNEAAADQGTTGSSGADLSTASQMTSTALAQVNTPANTNPGKVPLPGTLQLMLLGLVSAATLRSTKNKAGNNK
jgi:hypothetical protein